MVANNPEPEKSSSSEAATVSDWVACFNRNDNLIVLSCTVSAADSTASITGVGLILNTSEGMTLASFYTGLSGGSETVSPALNLAPAGLVDGDSVWAVAQGECDGQHFFLEQELTIQDC